MNIEPYERRNVEAAKLRQQQLDRIEKIVNRNDRALRGSNGDTGLVADVRALQKSAKERIWLNRVIVTAAIVVLGDLVFSLI